MAITSMKSAEGATPSRLFRMPRLAEIRAKGIISLTVSSAPCENGSKTGMSLLTLSRLNAETDATFPVLKNADCNIVRKKREVRTSAKVRDRKGDDDNDAGTAPFPFPFALTFICFLFAS